MDEGVEEVIKFGGDTNLGELGTTLEDKSRIQ